MFTFTPANSEADGTVPWGGVVVDAAGNIYGTTRYGGAYGMGTVFEILPPVGKSNKYQEKVLWNFNGTNGSGPQGGLILDGAGNLYGTTTAGGLYGGGVVFEVTP
ncbi:MAG: choice-of-anchor tandem repeat GloVer-containing protein [Terriglobales bacterium]